MKRLTFKNKIFPVSERLERPLYVIMAAFTWHMCFYMQCPLPMVIYEIKNLNWIFFLGFTNFFGALYFWSSASQLDFGSFIGQTQAYNLQPKNLPFGRNGLYGLVRHPQYLGQFIAFWSRAKMTEGDLLYAVSMTLYILIAVRYSEEPALIELIGDQYVEYTHDTPAYCPLRLPGMFCPQKKRKNKVT